LPSKQSYMRQYDEGWLQPAGEAGRRELGEKKLTVGTATAGYAAALRAVGGVADVLLQAGLGDAAVARGHRSVAVGAGAAVDGDDLARSVADALGVDDGSRSQSGEADDDGGQRELHLFGEARKDCFSSVRK